MSSPIQRLLTAVNPTKYFRRIFLSSMLSPNVLRKQVRALRRAMPSAERQRAVRQLTSRVTSLKVFVNAQHIAGYLAFDGELDPALLLEHAFAMGKQVYLPVLTGKPPAQLLFAPYRPDTVLIPNRFGIPEPEVPHAQLWPPQRLDLVLIPLVAFDGSGTRMGMGGGFYDRTFAFRRNPVHLPKPRLLGLAYELQKFPALLRESWDVPLDGIATEEALYTDSESALK